MELSKEKATLVCNKVYSHLAYTHHTHTFAIVTYICTICVKDNNNNNNIKSGADGGSERIQREPRRDALFTINPIHT